jgi:hypothetical protein
MSVTIGSVTMMPSPWHCYCPDQVRVVRMVWEPLVVDQAPIKPLSTGLAKIRSETLSRTVCCVHRRRGTLPGTVYGGQRAGEFQLLARRISATTRIE